jgi:hypothetical protein
MNRIFARAPVGKSRIDSDRFEIEHDFGHVLIFDTETTVDFSQRLRVGAFMLRPAKSAGVAQFGLFHAADLSEQDMATVRNYAATFAERLPRIISEQQGIAAADKNCRATPAEIETAFAPLQQFVVGHSGVDLLRRATFADFLLGAMQNRWPYHEGVNSFSAVVCLNALFDFGAIAAPAWERNAADSQCPVYAWGRETIRGGKGFTFSLCECPDRKFVVEELALEQSDGDFRSTKRLQTRVACPRHPNIVTRNLGGRKNQYGLSDGAPSGPIIDLSVLGRALLGPGPSSLRALGERMGAKILKREGETGHGNAITPEYLDYLIIDVLASAELYDLQMLRYEGHNLSTPIDHIFSEASIGKAYFAEFGVPDNIRARRFAADDGSPFDVRVLYAASQEAYQGGRSEVPERLVCRDVICADFKSQYPSVNALMGLQALLTAREYRVETGTNAIANAQALLSAATHEWLQTAANWRRLRILVKIDVAGCILPMKWEDGTSRKPYGLARLDRKSTAQKWFPLADVIASKLLTRGHMPRIIDAIEVHPVGIVDTIARNLFGRPNMRIDLRTDDLFTRLIDIRTEIKDRMDALPKDAPEYLVADNEQNNLKLIANATSYGVLAETMMEGCNEVAGRYYAPFIAAHITGGSRLLLALAQTLARDIGERKASVEIRHAMCDTDSMAFIRPEGVARELFEEIIADVTGFFDILSPYEKDKKLFAREKYKPGLDGAVWFFGVSCKRYCIFRHAENGAIELLKVSSHGLGPYRYDADLKCDGVAASIVRDDGELFECEESEDADDFSAIVAPGGRAKWKAWQAYMWTRAIERALGRRRVDKSEAKYWAGFPVEAWSMNATRLPQGVTTPRRFMQFAALGVRPGSFFATMPRRGKSKTLVALAGVAENGEAAMTGDCRDVTTGERLHPDIVRRNVTPLCEALGAYFVNPERKSRGDGNGTDQKPGRLELWTLTMGDVERRNRKGRAVQETDLFVGMEA